MSTDNTQLKKEVKQSTKYVGLGSSVLFGSNGIVEKIKDNKKYVGLASIALFGWEHVGRLYGTNIRPTIALNMTTDQLRTMFKYLGSIFARMSSVLTYIEFQELWKTCSDLFMSFFNLLTSFMYTSYGYCEKAAEYVGKENMIYIGSFLLLSGLAYLVYRYKNKSDKK